MITFKKYLKEVFTPEPTVDSILQKVSPKKYQDLTLYHVSTHIIEKFDINEYIARGSPPVYDPGIYFATDIDSLDQYITTIHHKKLTSYLYTINAKNLSLCRGESIPFIRFWTAMITEDEYPEQWQEYGNSLWQNDLGSYNISAVPKTVLKRSYDYLIKNNIDGSYLDDNQTQGDGDYICLWNPQKIDIIDRKRI